MPELQDSGTGLWVTDSEEADSVCVCYVVYVVYVICCICYML